MRTNCNFFLVLEEKKMKRVYFSAEISRLGTRIFHKFHLGKKEEAVAAFSLTTKGRLGKWPFKNSKRSPFLPRFSPYRIEVVPTGTCTLEPLFSVPITDRTRSTKNVRVKLFHSNVESLRDGRDSIPFRFRPSSFSCSQTLIRSRSGRPKPVWLVRAGSQSFLDLVVSKGLRSMKPLHNFSLDRTKSNERTLLLYLNISSYFLPDWAVDRTSMMPSVHCRNDIKFSDISINTEKNEDCNTENDSKSKITFQPFKQFISHLVIKYIF